MMLLSIVCLLVSLSTAQSSLVITGVIDGPLSGGVPKGVELYALADIADLSTYGIGSANNGGGSDGEEFTFPNDSVTAGQFIYIGSETTAWTSYFGFAPDYTSGAMGINGDDAIELFFQSSVVDVFGDINVDGNGEPWEYLDGWAYRMDGSSPSGSNFQLGEWIFSGPTALNGCTTNDGCSSKMPIGTFQVIIADTTLAIAPDNAVQAEGSTSPFTFTVTRSGDTSGVTTVDFAVSHGTTDATDFTSGTTPTGTVSFAAGETTQVISISVNDDSDPEPDETFTVTLSNPSGGAAITTSQATGTIENDDGVLITLISAIQGSVQGSADTSPMEGMTVTVEAVVIGDFQDGDADDSRNLRGFFLQEEDTDSDGDATTSEGIFVFDGGSPAVDVNVGDQVRVTGAVGEFFGQTQISATSVTVLSSNVQSPTPATISLPASSTFNDGSDFQPDLEAYEGMLVTFANKLTISEMFNLDRFNEIKLVQGERPFQFTQRNDPDNAGYEAHLRDVASRLITYDDGLSVQNALICNLDGFSNGACEPGAFNTATDIRMGDTISGLTGVLQFSFDQYRVRSVADGTNVFVKENVRPTNPPQVGGEYKIASVNVLNFFKTIDVSGATSGPNNLDPRGADNTEEFERQEAKLVRALVAMDADVYGLVELENDFAPGSSGNAIERLVTEMNNFVGGDDVYSWVNPGEQFVDSGDAISNGFVYKISSVDVIGQPAILRDADLPGLGVAVPSAGVFDGVSTNRASLAVGFQFPLGQCVLVSVNHFKSKGSVNPGTGNADTGNGASNNNAIRLLAAEAVNSWMNTDPTGSTCERKVILGDLNAYAKEDPVTYLESVGYTNVERAFNGDEAYSFVFDGQIGTLDYVLVNSNFVSEITGATTWHVNADEPDALDYNLDFGRDDLIFDGSSPVRFSDHDALLVGIEFASESPSKAPSSSPSSAPSKAPSSSPSMAPSKAPSSSPSMAPSKAPSSSPSMAPSKAPSSSPSSAPSSSPTADDDDGGPLDALFEFLASLCGL